MDDETRDAVAEALAEVTAVWADGMCGMRDGQKCRYDVDHPNIGPRDLCWLCRWRWERFQEQLPKLHILIAAAEQRPCRCGHDPRLCSGKCS